MSEPKPTATKQAGIGVSPRSGVAPPKNRQFGAKDGNPRHNGAWKKEDTARYKLEKMLKMTSNELTDIANDTNAPLFERRIATNLLKEKDFRTTAAIINQVYGMPKSQAPEGTIQRPKEDMLQ